MTLLKTGDGARKNLEGQLHIQSEKRKVLFVVFLK